MSPLISMAVAVSAGISVGEVLYGRLVKKREWYEIGRTIWDTTSAIAIFTGIVLFILHPTFK